MITTTQTNIINYLVICINDFAESFNISPKKSYEYLSKYGGIKFLLEHYEIEHTLSLDDAIDDLQLICQQNGGLLEG